MLNEQFAVQFAHEWVYAWNSHDIDAIMSHYADNIHFQSPIIIRVNNDPSGTITDKQTLKAYFSKALGIYTDLHFELYKVLVSINSVVLYYKTINDMYTAEYMEIDEHGKVVKVCAHYSN